MLLIAIALLVAGFGLYWSGISLASIGEAVAAVGWGIGLVVLVRLFVTLVLALAWRVLGPSSDPAALRDYINVRLVRDAFNSLLPVAQIGGDVVGARLLTLRGTAAPLAAASVVTDVFLQIITQFLFTLAGLALLLRYGGGETIAASVSGGLLVAIPVLIGLLFAQRRGAGAMIMAAVKKLGGGREWVAFAATDAFYAALGLIQSRTGVMATSAALHLFAWSFAAVEVYVALLWMGHPVTLAEAFVIESLAQAVRGAAFVVPGAIGVQEGGLVVLCAVFGVPAGPALALSLVKRLADLALGLPGLGIWYWLEGRHAR